MNAAVRPRRRRRRHHPRLQGGRVRAGRPGRRLRQVRRALRLPDRQRLPRRRPERLARRVLLADRRRAPQGRPGRGRGRRRARPGRRRRARRRLAPGQAVGRVRRGGRRRRRAAAAADHLPGQPRARSSSTTAEVNEVGLPIMVYNNPFDTKVDLTPDLVAELAQIENVVAVKEFSGDVRRVLEIKELLRHRRHRRRRRPAVRVAGGRRDRLVRRLPERVPEGGRRDLRPGHRPARSPRRASCTSSWSPSFRWDSRTEFVQAIKLSIDIAGQSYGGPTRPPRGPLSRRARAAGAPTRRRRSLQRTATDVAARRRGLHPMRSSRADHRGRLAHRGDADPRRHRRRRRHPRRHDERAAAVLHGAPRRPPAVPDERAARARRDERRDPAAADPARLRLGRGLHRGVRLPADVRARHDRRRHGAGRDRHGRGRRAGHHDPARHARPGW